MLFGRSNLVGIETVHNIKINNNNPKMILLHNEALYRFSYCFILARLSAPANALYVIVISPKVLLSDMFPVLFCYLLHFKL